MDEILWKVRVKNDKGETEYFRYWAETAEGAKAKANKFFPTYIVKRVSPFFKEKKITLDLSKYLVKKEG